MEKCIENYLTEFSVKNYKISGNENFINVTIDAGERINITRMKEVLDKETRSEVYIDATCIIEEGEYKLLIEAYRLPF